MTALTILDAPAAPLADGPIITDELALDDGSTFGKFALEHIRISSTNRKRFNAEKLQQLADSVREKGVAQPILIRPIQPTDEAPHAYEIVAGERRFRASIMAGLARIPAISKPMSDHDAIELQILENLQREDPHPLEEAEGYERLMLSHTYTPDQLADRLKKSRSYIHGRLKLCSLAKPLREQFYEEKFNASIAELIARLPRPDMQIAAAAELTKPDWQGSVMSFRDAREHLRRNYTVDLKGAAFSIKDASLVESAGPCTTCPQRAGNQPDYEGDPKAGNACTLPSCHREKEAAHAAKTRQVAEAKGATVIAGKEAEKIVANSYGSLRKGYADVDASFYMKGGVTTTYRKLLGKRTPIDTVVESPFDKTKLITVAKVEVLEELVREVAGAEVETAASRAAKDRAREKQQEKDAALEKQYRRDLFAAIREAGIANAPAIDEREVAVLLYGNCPNTEVDFIRKLYGWTGREYDGNHESGKWRSTTAIIGDKIRAMPLELARQVIRDMTMVRDLTINTYTGQGEKPTLMLAAADVAGINAKAIRKRLVDEEKAKQQAAAKKAAPKKVKPTQAEIPEVEPAQSSAPAPADKGLASTQELAAADIPAQPALQKPLKLEDLSGIELGAFACANPTRIDEVTKIILEDAPHLVAGWQRACNRAGYVWNCGAWHKTDVIDRAAEEAIGKPAAATPSDEVPRKTLKLKTPATYSGDDGETLTGPVVRTKKPARTVVVPATLAYTTPETNTETE